MILALVVGAGATAETAIYVVKQLGMTPVIFNRTYQRALDLKARYPGTTAVESLSELAASSDSPFEPALIISAVPGTAGIGLPKSFFAKSPICLDASLNPKETVFLKEAADNGCNKIIYGIEMLVYQGYMQQDIFTGRPCPKKVFRNACLSYYDALLKSQAK